MSKDVINVGGEDKVVREDTAKSYRGTVWALLSVAAFIVIVAIMFFGFFLKSATDNKKSETPGQMEQRTRQ
jgi:heme/copper-type cytochrome/quinol oxidase subunit 2